MKFPAGMYLPIRSVRIWVILILVCGVLFLFSQVLSAATGESLTVIKSVTGGKGNDEATQIRVLDENFLLVAGNTTSATFAGVKDVVRLGSKGEGDIFLAYVHRKTLRVEKLLIVGGTSQERLQAMDVDDQGNIFVAGSTFSSNFPHDRRIGTAAAPKKTDIFLLKVDKTLSRSVASLLIGGMDYDYPSAIHVSKGMVFLGGHTASEDFPVSPLAYNPAFNSKPPSTNSYRFDAFVASFDDSLASLNSATFISGEADEFITAIREGGKGEIILAGSSLSLEILGEKIDPAEFSGVNLFVAAINKKLTKVTRAFIYRPTNHLYSRDMVVDKDGSVFVTGYCTNGTLKTSHNALGKRYLGGGYDSFIVRLSSQLDEVMAVTYLGGMNNDFAQSIAFGEEGNVIVSGFTDSFDDFPVTQDANQSYFNFGHYDSFLVEMSRDLEKIFYSLVDGGKGYDFSYDMDVQGGTYFFTGNTVSPGKKKNVLIQKIFSNRQ